MEIKWAKPILFFTRDYLAMHILLKQQYSASLLIGGLGSLHKINIRDIWLSSLLGCQRENRIKQKTS